MTVEELKEVILKEKKERNLREKERTPMTKKNQKDITSFGGQVQNQEDSEELVIEDQMEKEKEKVNLTCSDSD